MACPQAAHSQQGESRIFLKKPLTGVRTTRRERTCNPERAHVITMLKRLFKWWQEWAIAHGPDSVGLVPREYVGRWRFRPFSYSPLKILPNQCLGHVWVTMGSSSSQSPH